MNKLYVEAIVRLIQTPFTLALLLFLPAGTFHYWEAWVFIIVLSLSVLFITIYLAIYDPELLKRRMNVGPRAEKTKTQKRIIMAGAINTILLLVLPAIDHRFNWSEMQVSFVILGNILIVGGLLEVFFVFRENTYTAANIDVARGQKVISTGPYGIIRHPMYSGALISVFGVPLALGSWWGLLLFPTMLGEIVWRLLDEEKYLTKNLAGYKEYCQKVRFRLIPHLW